MRNKGFNLIELMVVVAIVGILAAVAYPNYVDSVRKGRRADAKAELMAIAQKEEAYYATNGTYTIDLTQFGYPNSGWNNIPVGAAEQYYKVQVTTSNTCDISNCFIAEATPLGDQANDKVSLYRLYSNGKREREENGSIISSWND